MEITTFDPRKLNIFLDLDNTLISSIDKSEVDSTIGVGLRYIEMENYYRIYFRPFLQEFLDFLFKNFNVSVWTAASKSYAFFVVKNIVEKSRSYDTKYIMIDKPIRKIKVLLYDKNCEESQTYFSKDTPKDLTYLFSTVPDKFNKCNTIIIDDLKEVSQINAGNVIRANYFDSKNESSYKDVNLLKIMTILKKQQKIFDKTKCISL